MRGRAVRHSGFVCITSSDPTKAAYMAIALVIIHGLVAVALLGAISHQTLAAWAPAGARPGSFFGRFRTIPSASFANAIVVLYLTSALLGAILYLYFRVDVRPVLERDRHWQAIGFFDI